MRGMCRSLLVLAVVFGLGCGDDGGASPDAGGTSGTGGDSGTAGSGGVSGSGGVGATGGDGGSGGVSGSAGSDDAGIDAAVDAALDATDDASTTLDAGVDATASDASLDAAVLDDAGADATVVADGGLSVDAGDAGDAAVPEEPIIEHSCNVAPGLAAALTASDVVLGNNMRWLYPYDGTVFPRDLPSPTLQWESGPTVAAVLVRVRSRLLDVETCLTVNDVRRARIPQRIWNLAGTQSRGKDDPTTIELVVTDDSGDARRMATRTLFFARGALNDVVYYNTYGSEIANAAGITGGVVMRVSPGAADPELFMAAVNPSANCVGCHSVSANGSHVMTQENQQPGLVEANGVAYALSGRGTRPSAIPNSSLSRVAFAAMFPDGTVALTSGATQAGPIGTPHIMGTFGPEASRLVDVATGTTINASGVPSYALMPAFSTRGDMVAFNRVTSTSNTDGHTLSVMDFERTTNTFSNARNIYADANLYPGWPTFLPDVNASNDSDVLYADRSRVVFAVGDRGDFATQTITLLPPFVPQPHLSDLWWADIDSGMTSPLRVAGGFDGNDCYLPDCDGAHRDFMPYVSPNASGGYFWVYFVSRRSYGNLFPTEPNSDTGKRIWVAAIDIDAAPGTDPSHPAFVLPQPEQDSGSTRPVAARAVCRSNGNACGLGSDCCSGYCISGTCGVPSQPTCSALGDICETGDDCCDPETQACISGFCSEVIQ